MNVHIDFFGIWYAVKSTALIVVILVAGNYAADEAGFFLDIHPAMTEYLATPFAVPHTPAYKALAEDALIFPSHREVLTAREELIADKKDFLFADLDGMTITLYLAGEEIKKFPIKSKGKEGTFFETPNGLYSVRSKEANHLSSIAEVWMPWSMHFFGNYFIHGWPYYPNGKPVPEGFSGGCIRLTSADAKELYSLATPGMSVLAYAAETPPVAAEANVFFFEKVVRRMPLPRPMLTARAVLAVDFETGQILFEKNKDTVLPIASLTKLMTGLVAVETINRFKVLAMSESALATYGDSGGFTRGERFESQEYLYPLLLASSNDAATLFAQQVGGFVGIMNEKARGIGLTDTHFTDASGLDPGNVSTAQDLFKLLRFIDTHKKPLFAITGLDEYTRTSFDGVHTHTWRRVNWPKDERFVGGKSGFINEAGETMAGVWRVRLSENGTRTIAIITLGSESRRHDVDTIISYLENTFVYGSVYAEKDQSPRTVETGAAIFEAVRGWVD